jgi:hypothetical protein
MMDACAGSSLVLSTTWDGIGGLRPSSAKSLKVVCWEAWGGHIRGAESLLALRAGWPHQATGTRLLARSSRMLVPVLL